MSETHFRFRWAPRFRHLLKFSRFRWDLDGVRIHDDGNISITLGRRILHTTTDNISGVELVEGLLWPINLGVRRLPTSRKISFATDSGEGVRLTFREPVKPAAGPLWHEEVTITIQEPTELLPALLAARRAAESMESDPS